MSRLLRAVASRCGYRERLLEGAYPNHIYSIKHKLKDCDLTKNFITSRSLTQGGELEEDPGGSDVMPFPREDAIMMVYDGCLLQGGVTCLT
jgi:hypothetical protein